MSEQTNERHFTAEQYKRGVEPYEYLYSIINNPRLHVQEKARLIEEAKALKCGDIRPFYKAYLETQKAGRFQISQENSTQFTGQELTLDCGQYDCTDDGVMSWNQNTGAVTICPHPIMPTKRIINIDSGECKTEISFKRGAGGWRKAIFDKSILASAQKIIQLASQGIAVDSENARGLVAYLSWMENANYSALPELKSVGRLGWTKHGFSPYVDGLIFDGQEQYRQAFQAVHQKGDLQAWIDAVRAIRTSGNVAARAMLAASFASVLVGKLEVLPFIIHGWSNISGIGKTVLLMCCGSVWADPAEGEYIKSYNMTQVGLEILAGFYGSLPLCLDELQLRQGKREQFDDMIYQYCEGVGRTRATKSVGLQRVATWRNCCISTGEEPLTNSNSKAGAINRVLDFDIGDKKIFDDPHEVASIVRRNYGLAGRVFVEKLSDAVIEGLHAMYGAFVDQLNSQATDKQASSAAMILTADAFIDAEIFHDGLALTANDLLPMLQTREDTDVNRRCYEWIVDVVAANQGHFIPRDGGTYDGGECWGKIDQRDGHDCAIINSTVFRRLMQAEGYSTKGFLSWAKKYKKITCSNDKKHPFEKQIRIGSVQTWCICLTLPRDGDDYQIVQEEWPQ